MRDAHNAIRQFLEKLLFYFLFFQKKIKKKHNVEACLLDVMLYRLRLRHGTYSLVMRFCQVPILGTASVEDQKKLGFSWSYNFKVQIQCKINSLLPILSIIVINYTFFFLLFLLFSSL